MTAILFNIFGGITRCDEIAKGIVTASQQIDLGMPLVVRLDGTNFEEGLAILAEANLPNLHQEKTMLDAARRVVELAGRCLVSIIVDGTTKLAVSGLTGREGSFHGLRNKAYGTDLVAGVTPGKGGQDVEGTPVFDTIKEAVDEAGANTSMIFVPARFAAPAINEAIDSGVETVIAITEGIPVLDMLATYWKAKEAGVRLIGPNCPGVLSPGKANVGIIPDSFFDPNFNPLGGATLSAGVYDLITFAVGSTFNTPTFTLGVADHERRVHRDPAIQCGHRCDGDQIAVGGLVAGQLRRCVLDGADGIYWESANNFATTISGTTPTLRPGSASNVYFTANGATNLSNLMSDPYTINSLNFTSVAGAVNIGGLQTLTLSPAAGHTDSNAVTHWASVGLVVETGAPAETISAAVTAGVNQTWEIDNDPANPLTLTGLLNSAAGVTLTKTGTGAMTLSTANIGFLGTLAVNNGTVFANTSLSALGGGTVSLGGGTSDFNNSAALAFARNTTLTGGSSAIVSERNRGCRRGLYARHTVGRLGEYADDQRRKCQQRHRGRNLRSDHVQRGADIHD